MSSSLDILQQITSGLQGVQGFIEETKWEKLKKTEIKFDF